MKIYFACSIRGEQGGKEEKFEALSNMLKGCNEPKFKLLSWQTKEDVAQILLKELGRAEHE